MQFGIDLSTRNPIHITGLARSTASDAGNYTVELTNARGATTSVAAALTVDTTVATTNADPGHLTNLSIRANAASGAHTLTVGFVLGGSINATFNCELLMRVVGPSLAQFGVAGTLPDPRVSLFSGSFLRATAENWSKDSPGAIDGFSPRFGAFQLTSTFHDAAFTQNALPRGAYTIQATSAIPGQSGIVLAEVYDLAAPLSTAREFTNVSARTTAGVGDATLIAGFVIGGSTARTVLIRAAGPALTGFGVPGVLTDPRLTLVRDSVTIAENDNWSTSESLVNTFASVGAFDFVARSKDAVLYLTLPPGAYTAQVSGPDTTTGVALVEIYVLP